MDTRKEKISFVIPCYNSERSIAGLLKAAVETIQEDGRYDYEAILVNDGSKDNTWDVIKGLAEKDHQVLAINLSRNFGQHNALIAAYRCATGDIIVGADDDGEHDPADLFKLVDELTGKGLDYVCAAYRGEKKDSVFRNFGTRANNLMAHILIGQPKEFKFSSYYAARRFVIRQVAECRNPYPYVAGLVLQAAGSLGMVELAKHERKYGKSGYNVRKLLKLWLNGFTAFSVKPLRIATVMGMLVAFSGFVYGCAIIWNKCRHPELVLPGYSSIAAILLLIGGMLMILLGMVGEYVGRIYMNINNIPQYVVSEKIDHRKREASCADRKK
ncbi:MAG: glycosyltransferase family 2 protein [Eubacterium sp.]|nr:glycosyltransferase family 2 protein [Eubacterium sp.]